MLRTVEQIIKDYSLDRQAIFEFFATTRIRPAKEIQGLKYYDEAVQGYLRMNIKTTESE